MKRLWSYRILSSCLTTNEETILVSYYVESTGFDTPLLMKGDICTRIAIFQDVHQTHKSLHGTSSILISGKKNYIMSYDSIHAPLPSDIMFKNHEERF